MEASSSRGRSGSTALKRHRGVGAGTGSGSGSSSGSTAQSLNDDTLRSVFSRLDDHFDLARCSAVCSSWIRGKQICACSLAFSFIHDGFGLIGSKDEQ